MATFNEIPDGVGLLVSGEAIRTLRYNGSYESVVCLADNFRDSINNVSVQSYNGELVYVFGNERGGLYGVTNGTYRFLVPQAYPIAFHTAGRTAVSYTGENLQGSKAGLDGNTYQFFWGIVTLTVTGDFGRLSYQSFNNGYLGGFRHIDHTTTVCYNSLTNRQKGAEASVSGTSISNPVAFFARYNIEATAVDAFTAGGVANIFVTRLMPTSGGARLEGIAFGIKNPIISTVRLRVGGDATIEGGNLSNPIVKGGQTSAMIPAPGGGVVWQNTSGALREKDLQSATLFFDTGEGLSNYLYISNFNLDLPQFATPTAINVRIRKSSSVGEVIDDTVALVYKVGNNLFATENKAISGFWPQTASSFNYGGSTDTWGRLWSRAEVLNPNFGIIVSALGDPALSSRAAIDYIELSVYYLQLVDEQSTGGNLVSGSAEYGVVTERLMIGGARSSGLALNIYLNIDAQGGATLSGECITETTIKSISGLAFLGGSSDVQFVGNGNSQSVIFLRSNNQNVINTVSVRPVGPTWRGDWQDINYNKNDIVRENNTFYVCLQYWDASETRTPTEDISSYGGAYWAVYTEPLSYVFGEEYGRYGIVSGTYKFNIPAAYPIAFLNFGRATISFTGTQPQGSKVGLDGNTYTFFYGEVTLTVGGAWNRLPFSYQSWDNGYLGGQNNITYSAAAVGQNTDLVLGGEASISINVERNTSSGVLHSGTSVVRVHLNPIIESYGVTLSGEADRILQSAISGGLQLSGTSEVDQVFNPVIFATGFLANGTATKSTNYEIELETKGILLSGLGTIAIQPKTGDGSIIANGSAINLTSFGPVLMGYAAVGGFYILQQTYNSIIITGYGHVSGKARQERIRRLIKTTLNRSLSMASPNILNTPKPDPNKLIRSVESDQPAETTSTSYRLQHEPGWCDIGESCNSPYLPAIIKKRQGKYIPDKRGRYVASRQIATMTQE